MVDDDDFLVVGDSLEAVEDDDWREISPIRDTSIRQGDWIKPVDVYHSRGLDIGLVEFVDKGILDVFWVSDGLVQRCYAEDFKTVGTPTDDDKSLAISHKLLPLDPACSDRVKTGKRLSTGDYVQSRSVYSRFGDRVGLVTGVVEGDLVVKWQHIKGHKPKDSRRSFQRKFWGDADLIRASPNWVECYNKVSKKK